MSGLRIEPLRADDEARLHAVAAIMVAGFREMAPHAWPTDADALSHLHELFAEDGRISLVAVDGDGQVVGFIGGTPTHEAAMELHPLVVDPATQRRGVGTALVAALEAEARAAGRWTMWLGTDDEAGWTTLGGAEVYPDPLAHAAALADLHGHPFAFYRRLGYAVCGILPDANGFGKPDIFMARRLRDAAE